MSHANTISNRAELKETSMSVKTPKISVLMSAYNSEKYVAEAIESILNQTFKDFEFIIVNDGSTDKTAEIIAQYAKSDKRIKFIDNKNNAGIVAALNQGLDFCNGEYVARMDSDDISLPERFAKQLKYMDGHPECGALGAWAEKFGPSVKRNDGFRYRLKLKLLDFIIYGDCVVNPTAMVRRSILIDNNIKYEPEYKYAEDYAFWIEVSKIAEIHNLPEVLLKYRWHNNNVSVMHRKAQTECTERIRRNVLKQLLDSKSDTEKLLRMTREVHERFWLFGILPIVRRKQYSITKTKYYLFEKLPIIREQDGKIYIFECIKIGCMK